MNTLSLSWNKPNLPARPRGLQCSQHGPTRSYDAFVLEANPLLSSAQLIEDEANLRHDTDNINIEQTSPLKEK